MSIFNFLGGGTGGGVSTEVLGSLARGAHEGRIVLASATSIEYDAVIGLDVGLWDGVKWVVVCPTSSISMANTLVDLDSNALVVDALYDIFAEYASLTNFNFVAKKWSSAGGGSSARAAALYEFDGVLVHENSANGKKRRYLGTIYTYNNAATVNFKDEKSLRFISNHYNKVSKGFGVDCPYSSTESDVAPSGSWESWNNNGDDYKFESVNDGLNAVAVHASLTVLLSNGRRGTVSFGVNAKTVTAQATNGYAHNNETNNAVQYIGATYSGIPVVGYNYFYPLQLGYLDGGTITFRYYEEASGATNATSLRAGVQGEIVC